MKQALYVLIGVLAGFVLAGMLLLVVRLPAGKAVTLEPAPTKAPFMVHVIGAVVRPGVYELPEGSRVQDAVEAAGGLLAEADPNAMNLAARVEDGQQLDVPYKSGAGPSSSSSPNNPFPFTVISSTPTANPSAADLVNINTATLQELDALPGIGPTTAQNIINYRQQHGPFQHIEDIMNVPGIGPATFDRLSSLITVGS